MEEISHEFLHHKPTTLLMRSDGLNVRDYDEASEREAYGVGAAALIPWNQLFGHLSSGATKDELAEEFDVTVQLVQYRINITGAHRLYVARQNASV